jgi:glycosyltransferase involved in cell wall biosynthesis
VGDALGLIYARTTVSVRVLVVDHVGAFWGAEQYLARIAPMLRAHDVELELATPPGAFADAWRDLGLRARPLDLPVHRGIRNPDGATRPGPAALAREAVVVARSAGRLARQAGSVDVLHSNSMAANVEVALAGRLARRSVVLDVHDIVVPGLGQRMLGAAARIATVTIAWSQASAETVGGADRSDVELIAPGIDVHRFTPGPADPEIRRQLSASGEEVLIGILGRIDPIKRIDIAIEAMARSDARRAGARLVVVGAAQRGGAAYADEIRALAASRLSDEVVFAGARDDVPDVLRALDVIISTNAAEPFGLSLLEAQSTAKPVVASRGGGVVDFIEDGVTGMLVPPLDPASLARAIDDLVSSSELRARLGRAAREQTVESFDVERQVERRAAVYHRAAGSRR